MAAQKQSVGADGTKPLSYNKMDQLFDSEIYRE